MSFVVSKTSLYLVWLKMCGLCSGWKEGDITHNRGFSFLNVNVDVTWVTADRFRTEFIIVNTLSNKLLSLDNSSSLWITKYQSMAWFNITMEQIITSLSNKLNVLTLPLLF